MFDMNLSTFSKLAHCSFGKYFLLKSYSLELAFLLLQNKNVEGVDKCHFLLVSAKPKPPAFYSFIALLENKRCIIRNQNPNKRSERVIALTEDCREALLEVLDQN